MIIPKGSNPNYQHFRQVAHDLIDELNPSFPWKIVATRHRKKRSNPQNKYFWGVVVKMICDETGNESQDIHDVLCGECFGWVQYDCMGRTKVRPARGTSDLLVDEFETFCEWCRAYAARNVGLVIPLPNEVM